MHTTKLENCWSAIHDDVPSNDSLIEFVYTSPNNGGKYKIKIPYGIIKAFVAEQVRNRRMFELEYMGYDSLLK